MNGAYQLSRVAPAVERAERMKVIMVGALARRLVRWFHIGDGCIMPYPQPASGLRPPISVPRTGWPRAPLRKPGPAIPSCSVRSSYPTQHGHLGPRCCPRPVLRGQLGGRGACRNRLGHRWGHHCRHRSEEERVRLLYIDTPESKTNAHGEASREGKLAAEFLDLQVQRSAEHTSTTRSRSQRCTGSASRRGCQSRDTVISGVGNGR